MISGIFAQHQSLIRDYPSAPPPPPAPPAPPTPPQPPQPQPIAFSVIARDSLFGITGSAIGTITLATVTCTDGAMTISASEAVPGLTFSYAAKVLTISGTPTTPTGVHRVVVSYIASDGSNTIRGSTTHEITIVAVAEVLTIGTIAGITGRVGDPLNQVICTPTANFDANVLSFGNTTIRGLTAQWTWNRALRTGELRLIGTPLEGFGPNGGYSFAFIANQQVIGSGSSSCTIVQGHQAPAPAPAPAPSPAPPAPSPPPAPAPAPAPGLGPDPLFSAVKALLHFNSATGLLTDVKGNVFSATGTVSSDVGAVAEGLRTSGVSFIQGQVNDIDAATNFNFTAECMVDLGQTAWDALNAPGTDERYCAVLTYLSATGQAIWMLGFARWSGSVFPIFWHLASSQIFPRSISSFLGEIPSRPARFVHLAYSSFALSGNGRGALWLDGAPMSPVAFRVGDDAAAGGSLRIGGVTPAIRYLVNAKDALCIPFDGVIDEVRVTPVCRYQAYIGSSATAIPLASRVIPWPNY